MKTTDLIDTSAANKPRHSWRGRIWPLEYPAFRALGTLGFSPGGLHYEMELI